MAYLLDWATTVAALVPALAANGAPVLLTYRGTPIDGGHKFLDSRRILGDGKTWEGFATGLLYGAVLAYIISMALHNLALFVAGVASSAGAMVGDMLGAFIKRRLGIERGAPAPVLDQLDFYSGALVALYLSGFIVDPATAALMAPLVLLLHRATNIAANKLRLKPVPW